MGLHGEVGAAAPMVVTDQRRRRSGGLGQRWVGRGGPVSRGGPVPGGSSGRGKAEEGAPC